MDEPTAEPLDPSFFDFDYGEALSKEQLKGACSRLFTDLLSTDGGPVLIYEEVTRPRAAQY